MSILEINTLALRQRMRLADSCPANQIERHERTISTSTQPVSANTFFNKAWNWVSSFLAGRRSDPAPKLAAACDRLLTRKTCSEISDGYFHALYREACAKDSQLSPRTFVPQQRDYANEHACLRESILQESEFKEKFKALSGTARFYLAEMEAHKRQLYADKYPPVFMSRIERVVARLSGHLIRSFGLSPSVAAAGQEIRDDKVSKLASDCFAKIRNEIPRNMRPRISPGARMKYCGLFDDIHTNLQKVMPTTRFPDRYVAVFAHEQALKAIASKLPDPSSGASNPDRLPQRAVWMRNVRSAALEFLGVNDKMDEQSYEARISGNDGLLSRMEKQLLLGVRRYALARRRCKDISAPTGTSEIPMKREEFPLHLLNRKNELNETYRRLYGVAYKKLQANYPGLDCLSRSWLICALAHVAIDTMTTPELPMEYLAWIKPVR